MSIGYTNTQLTSQANAAAAFNNQLGADAVYMLSFYAWCKKKSAQYTANIGSAAVLQATPYSETAGDANASMLIPGDINRLITYFEGGSPVASNVVNNASAAAGIGTF